MEFRRVLFRSALLDEEREAADGDVAVVCVAGAVEAVHRARAPTDDAGGERADGVGGLRVDESVLLVRHRHLHADDAADVGLKPGGGLPDAAAPVNARHDARYRAARVYVLARA